MGLQRRARRMPGRPADVGDGGSAEGAGMTMDSNIQVIDAMDALWSRAHGIEAAITGCIAVSDRHIIEGVLALYHDHLDALAEFKEELETFLGMGDAAEKGDPD